MSVFDQNILDTGDADPKLMFDIEKFLSHDLKLKKNDTYDVIDADAIARFQRARRMRHLSTIQNLSKKE